MNEQVLKKILLLCTGNSCRSQMAEGFLRKLAPEWKIVSAGTRAEKKVNPFAIKVMEEAGIDISSHYPKTVEEFLDQEFDYVITLCDSARQTCPVFTGNVRHNIHIGFPDPADATGSTEEILAVYRSVRDNIETEFTTFINSILKMEK